MGESFELSLCYKECSGGERRRFRSIKATSFRKNEDDWTVVLENEETVTADRCGQVTMISQQSWHAAVCKQQAEVGKAALERSRSS
jgi:hypothetical protein